ncbi:MAG: chalcone isomerase [Bacteroidetes bacterium]|nr:chalcone isomerase [Bacteroidota bacterium]
MKKITLTLGLIACLAITASAQITVSGVTFPGTMKAGANNLVLNGAGTRVKMMMDVYVAGLYVTAKGTNGDAISKSGDMSVVRLHITSGLVTSDRMVDAVKDGFQKSTGGNTAPIQAKIDRFVKLFSLEPIVKGNEFDMVYEPGKGVTISKGGKLLDTIDGLDFKTALWGIWLGNDPVDKGLKAGLLGTPK